MDSKFHADRFGGALVSQVNKFVSAYDRFDADFTWNIVTSITAFVASMVILFFLSPLYAAVLFVISVLFMFVIYKRMNYQAPFNRRLASSESERTGKLADAIT